MDKSKRDIYFHNLLGLKWHMQMGRNAVLSGQQKQQNIPAGHVIKVVAASHGLCPVAVLNGVYEPMDLDINIGKDNEIFSSRRRLKAYISVH